uniref:Uncharacterized protein n=1 Tax=Daphnia galeata TaxID=27404 RepID=A0A8J2WRI9_9CRUS|nr:unnamed protein product [Daphnia galeata]
MLKNPSRYSDGKKKVRVRGKKTKKETENIINDLLSDSVGYTVSQLRRERETTPGQVMNQQSSRVLLSGSKEIDETKRRVKGVPANV